jgi:hypothetical protein
LADANSFGPNCAILTQSCRQHPNPLVRDGIVVFRMGEAKLNFECIAALCEQHKKGERKGKWGPNCFGEKPGMAKGNDKYKTSTNGNIRLQRRSKIE